MSFSLTIEQYEALISLAQKGVAGNPQQQTMLDTFLQSIEQANGIIRSSLWIQWQEANTPLPPGARFPQAWPPSLRFFLQLVSRKICLADVQQVLTQKANNPVSVMVTPDPAALVGWTPLDTYFVR
jgi:hypothetical protein